MIHSNWKNVSKIFFFLVLHYIYYLDSGHAHASNIANSTILPKDAYDLNIRELASLSEKWNLTDNGVMFEGMDFQLDYIVSDFILDSMIEAVAYDIECQEGGVVIPSSDMSYSLVFDDSLPGDGDMARDVYVDLRVNPGIKDSLVYKDVIDPVTGEAKAEVEFCMRISLWTSTSTPIEANYLETIVGFKANLTSGFDIDTVLVAPKEKLVLTAAESYEVDAFLCDENNEQLAGAALTTARTQGEVVRACVTPNQESRDSDIFMRAIQKFTWFRDYGGGLGMVAQVAVEDSQEASNFLTVLYCTRGSITCAFESVLFASMFLTPGEVSGTGTALLQIGDNPDGRRRRDLESSSLSRSLQGGDDEVPATEFDLDFELQLGEEFTGIVKTSSSPKMSFIYSIVAVGVVASLNLMSIILY